MPQNSTEGTNATGPTPLGDFLRHPEEVMGAPVDPDRAREMAGRALSAEVDALSGTRAAQVEVLEAKTAEPGTREGLDRTDQALLDASADLFEHQDQGSPGANLKDK